MRRVLLDAGPWLALFHSADRQHQRCVEWLRREGQGIHLISTWPVLTEVAFFLRAASKQRVLEWVARGAVQLAELNVRDRQLMHAVIGRFADQRPDLADASLLAIAERLGISEIATFDHRDFAVYRIGRNETLQLTDFDTTAPGGRARRPRR